MRGGLIVSKNMERIGNVDLTPRQHVEAAEDYISSAEERQNDPGWAMVEVEIAKTHLLAAAMKTALSFLGDDKKGFKAAPAVLGLVTKLAR
jgi:hypothetical protein